MELSGGKRLENILSKNKKTNPSLHVEDSPMYELAFYKIREDFMDFEYMVRYIKSIEKMVRTHRRYKEYIRYLREEVGLKCCVVLSDVDCDSASIEMHHGPILTLFDITFIILNHHINTKGKVNTFRLAKEVLDQHFKNNIQVVMLSKTVHEQVHKGNVFINLQQAHGHFNKFIRKYIKGLTEEHINIINHYIELSKEYDSTDNGLLEISEAVIKWEGDNGYELIS